MRPKGRFCRGGVPLKGPVARAAMIRHRRLIPVVASAAALLMLSACRMNADVDVTVDGDGSGLVVVTVTADDDAVAAVPELSSGLRLDDIREAGWTTSGIQRRADGGVTLEASKEFHSAGQLQSVLDELAGPGVIFSDVVLAQSRSFARTGWDFSAVIDPSPPLEAFSDPGLAAALNGHFFGRPPQELQAGTKASKYFFGLDFSLTLPVDIAAPDAAAATPLEDSLGAKSDEADTTATSPSGAAGPIPAETPGEVSGSTLSWHFSYGEAPVAVSTSAVAAHSAPQMWLNISRATAAAFGVVLLISMLAWLATAIRTPKGRGRRATRRRKQRAATRAAEASKPPKRLLRLLVVDVHGVLVRPIDPLQSLLLPVILKEMPDIDPAFVRDRYRNLVLGRLTPGEFWSDLGLGPIGMQVETRYLSSYRLVPGLHPFLDSVAAQRLPVVALGNQPRHWGTRLQRMAQLEDLTALWLTSAEVGATLPYPPLLEAARRKMSVDVHDCLYLSSVPTFLDAAKELGMSTAYFAASPDDMLEVPHTVVRGFTDLLRGRNLNHS